MTKTSKPVGAESAKIAEHKSKIPIVAIGASAGGLEPFEKFFDSMPVQSGIAFVVIQHLSPDFESMMDELLSRHSSMDIERVIDGMTVKPNTIYLNPPRSKMIIEDGRFNLQDKPHVKELNLPIDIFFASLAIEYGREAIAIVLSGTGSDGTRGAAMVKGHEGTVLVQTPASSKFDGMPRSVIESGNYDAMATPSEMPSLIKRVRDGKSIDQSYSGGIEDDPEKHIFLRLRDKYGTDFGYYKEATLTRRFERRAQLAGTDLIGYARRLETDADELDALYADMLIDVTSFFRDIKGFKAIGKHAVEHLGKQMTHDRQIRIWIAGCSSGEEAYSFAIAFAEFARENNLPLNIKILATDVHQRSLGAASEGLYPKTSLTGLSEEQIDRYFEKHVDYYQVSQQLRRLVVFSQHNLLRDPPFTRIDLVSCRNVMIYFQEQAQQKTLALFHFALKVDGILFLGPSESLGRLEDEFETLDRRWKIYKKLRDVRLIEATSLLPRDSENRPKPEFKTPFMTAKTGTLQRFKKAHGEALEMMIKEFAPPGFLLNKKGEIVHVFGTAGRYVSIDGGVFSNLIVDLIDPQLKLAITTGLERLTTAEKLDFERRVLMTDEDGKPSATVIVSLKSLTDKSVGTNHFLLTLVSSKSEKNQDETLPKFLDTSESTEILRKRNQDLERDLASTEQSLQSLVEELQTSNEELQATNEELMASNEELQSTNEELHSVNEELYTVSAEHQRKIDELTVLSDDMNSLLKATSIGILFLGDNLSVRRFTPSAIKAFNLLDQDIGRPFEHTTYRFDDDKFLSKIENVLKTKKMHSQEVSIESDVYMLNILPYETSVKDASGVVITIVEVTELKTAERARIAEKEIFETAVNDLTEAIVRVNLETGKIELANDVYANYYDKISSEVVGAPFAKIEGKERAKFRMDSLKKYKAGDTFYEQAVVEGGSLSGRVLSRSIRLIGNENGETIAFQGTAKDITEESRYAKALEALIAVEDSRDIDFDSAVEQVLEIGCDYLGLSSAISAKIEGDEFIVEHVHGQKPGGATPGIVLNYGDTFCYFLPKEFEPVALPNVGQSDLNKETCYKNTGIETYIGLRTMTSKGQYGALSFSSDEPRADDFTEMERTMTQLLSRTIGAFLERKLQLKTLEDRQSELENVNEGLKRFTYLASHDLQEPLRKIQQSGEMLQMDTEGKLDDDSAYFLKIMIQSSGRMRSLIEDLLLYSASANQELEKSSTSLKDIFEDAIEELQDQVTQSNAQITVNKLPAIACDPIVMKQVFVNVLSNSLKYKNLEKAPTIKISAKTLKKMTQIRIQDNGIGMDLNDKTDIFEPFIRLHSKSEYSGSGIGLAICKSVCDRHGWKIDVESKLGVGTTIIFSIPNEDIS